MANKLIQIQRRVTECERKKNKKTELMRVTHETLT